MDVGESDSQSSKTPPQVPDPVPAAGPPPLPPMARDMDVEVTVSSVTVVPTDNTSGAPMNPAPILDPNLIPNPNPIPGLSTGSMLPSMSDVPREVAAPGTSNPVVASGGWVPRSVLSWFVVLVSLGFLIGSFCRFVDGVIGGKVPFNSPSDIVLYLLPTALPALGLGFIGTLMGWATLIALRRSNGQKRGLFAGLVAAMSWPLLVLMIFGFLAPAGMLAGYLARQGNLDSPDVIFTGALALSAVMDLVLLIVVSRWAASLKKARAALAPGARLVIRHRPILVALGAFLHIAASIAIGFASTAFVGSRAHEERNRPMPGFEEPDVPPATEVIPEPPPEIRPQRPRIAVELDTQLMPGASTRARHVLLPQKGRPALVRMTFWSNGIPVDLPGLSFQSPFQDAPEQGVQAEWELKRAEDGAHYTLSAPRLTPKAQEVPTGQATFEIPEGIQLVPVPNDDQVVMLRSVGPTRRWLFLSVRDAQMGARLNAEWGVSLDFAMPADP